MGTNFKKLYILQNQRIFFFRRWEEMFKDDFADTCNAECISNQVNQEPSQEPKKGHYIWQHTPQSKNIMIMSIFLVKYFSSVLKRLIFKAQVKLRYTSAFNRLKFLSFYLSIFLSLSDIPNLDLNNPTNPLLKSTLVQLVYISSGYCRY